MIGTLALIALILTLVIYPAFRSAFREHYGSVAAEIGMPVLYVLMFYPFIAGGVVSVAFLLSWLGVARNVLVNYQRKQNRYQVQFGR